MAGGLRGASPPGALQVQSLAGGRRGQSLGEGVHEGGQGGRGEVGASQGVGDPGNRASANTG